MEAIKVPTVGEERLPPLTDNQLKMICNGLLIPSQGAGKSMAYELRKLRGDTNPDSI